MVEFPLQLPARGLPTRMGSSYLARLWDVDYRNIVRWAELGLLEFRQEGLARVYYRPAVEAFARAAIPVRLLKPDMVVRHPRWAAGTPVRVIEALPGPLMWSVTYRTADGTLEHPPRCPGYRIVLQVPDGQAGDL